MGNPPGRPAIWPGMGSGTGCPPPTNIVCSRLVPLHGGHVPRTGGRVPRRGAGGLETRLYQPPTGDASVKFPSSIPRASTL